MSTYVKTGTVSMRLHASGASEVERPAVKTQKIDGIPGSLVFRATVVPWSDGTWLARLEKESGREVAWALGEDIDDALLAWAFMAKSEITGDE